jgi:hypothetical protein
VAGQAVKITEAEERELRRRASQYTRPWEICWGSKTISIASVRAVVAIGRVGDVAAGVANARRDDVGPLAQQVLHSPEAVARQDRLLGRLDHRSLLRVR